MASSDHNRCYADDVAKLITIIRVFRAGNRDHFDANTPNLNVIFGPNQYDI